MTNGNHGEPASDDTQSMLISLRRGQVPERRSWTGEEWAADEFAAPDERVAGDLAAGITSLGYIRSAVRRRARLWCALAAIGLIAGAGVYVARPAPYQATTTLLVANPPGSAPGVAVQNDQAIIESRTVAGAALRILGIDESPASFVGQYTSTVITDQVLGITVKSKSPTEAVSEANALAKAFLAFQARLLQTQAGLVNAALQQQVAEAEQNVSSLSAQISTLTGQAGSSTQLSSLKDQRARAETALTTLRQNVTNNQASSQVAITTALKESQVLDAAVAISPSKKKRLLLYGGGGLFAGLVLGLAIVVVGAVASERLRRRDDVARMLGASVRLSIRPVKLGSRKAGLGAADHPAIRRVAAHLTAVLAANSSPRPASLAVVPADDVGVPALCLASMAVSCAGQSGARVIVADLCEGAPLGRIFGVGQPGAHPVSIDGVQLLVAVPEPDDVPQVGPLADDRTRGKMATELASACRSADLLLTLAPLDPATGSDHLPGWAENAVVTVTAGLSSAARVYALGQMIRLADVSLISAVLLGADKADESLGAVRPVDIGFDGRIPGPGPASTNGFMPTDSLG